MPNISEFVGPKPTDNEMQNLEKIVGKKPCSKCDADVDEAFWNPVELIMSWTCPAGHLNTFKIN